MNGLMKAVLIAGALAIVACDKPQDQKPADPAATPATTATAPNANTNANTATNPVATAQPATTIADTDLVSPADYESEEETAITAKNYKAEISSIETEMAKE
jgi:hypothetical protein